MTERKTKVKVKRKRKPAKNPVKVRGDAFIAPGDVPEESDNGKKKPVRKKKTAKRKTRTPKASKTGNGSSVKKTPKRKTRASGDNTPAPKRTIRLKRTKTSPKESKAADAAKGRSRRDAASKYQRKIDSAARDIGGPEWEDLVANIDWDRRLSTKHDLKRFNEIYLPNIFYLGWSKDQLRCVRKTESVFIDDGMFALAMPRAGGKTAIVRGGITWGTLHGHKRFPFNIGSSDPKSLQTLEAVKTFLYGNPLLLQDFPEICWAVKRAENRFHLARGQTFYGNQTFIQWGSSSVRFPCCLMDEQTAEIFNKHDEGSINYLESHELWIPRNAGVNIATAGIGGSIRGEAETHPVTLEQPRPDCVILDDIQKDQKAESPNQVDKLEALVQGAIGGLAGPGGHIATIVPCTVTVDGDFSDRILDPVKNPEYRGERCQLVVRWPEGLTDFEIGMDTEPGKLWNEYDEVRRQSFRDFEVHSNRCKTCRDNHSNPCKTGKAIKNRPTNLYKKNRAVMDEGFEVSWDQRFGNPKLQPDGSVKRKDPLEISAQQHAMNLRLKSPLTFPPEYQNRGRKLTEEGAVLISPLQLAEKTVALGQGEVAPDCQYISAFIDVQNEALFYAVLALSPNFTGNVIDYGTFPEIKTRYFRKNQLEGWGYLTRMFFEKYPEHKHKAIKTDSGRVQAPLEPKIYHALSQCVPYLLQKEYFRTDENRTLMRIQALGIDTRWGQASDCIKRYIRESGLQRTVFAYQGQRFPPTNKQLEEYQRTGQYQSWLFEDQKHPSIKDPKWVIRPNPDGQWYFQADVNRLKDFLFHRLASPPGSKGSISLFNGTIERHEMFADSVAGSEYPEPVTARGLTKNQWQPREGIRDNEGLDCLVGCVALGSFLGACLQTDKQDGTVQDQPRKADQGWKRRLRSRMERRN